MLKLRKIAGKADGAGGAVHVKLTQFDSGAEKLIYPETDALNVVYREDYTVDDALKALEKSAANRGYVYLVPDIPARNALSPTSRDFCWVKNATEDTTVSSGAALYFYAENAWVKIAEVEGLDVPLLWSKLQGVPENIVPAGEFIAELKSYHIEPSDIKDALVDIENNMRDTDICEGKIAELEANRDTLTSANAENASKIAELSGQYTQLREKVHSHSSEIGTLDSDVELLKSNWVSAQQNIAKALGFETRLDEHDSEIADLSSDLTDLANTYNNVAEFALIEHPETVDNTSYASVLTDAHGHVKGGSSILDVDKGGTGATTAEVALSKLGAASANDLNAVRADLAELSEKHSEHTSKIHTLLIAKTTFTQQIKDLSGKLETLQAAVTKLGTLHEVVFASEADEVPPDKIQSSAIIIRSEQNED